MLYTNYYPASGLFHVSLPLLMGTRMDVLLFGEDRNVLETLWNSIEKELRRLEKMLNRFDPFGETATVNREAAFAKVQLSDQLWDILLDCRRYYQETNGYFDITTIDFSKTVFMDDSHSILFEKYGMSLDFGGYAKGYALQWMRQQLKEAGMKRALVNFGNSSVLAIGAHPHGDSWPIGIEDPSNGAILSTFHLCNNSLSVSGNTPSHALHIKNPKISEFISGDRIVAIVAEDPIDAEVLTTAWIASGDSAIPAWMTKFNLKNIYNIK